MILSSLYWTYRYKMPWLLLNKGPRTLECIFCWLSFEHIIQSVTITSLWIPNGQSACFFVMYWLNYWHLVAQRSLYIGRGRRCDHRWRARGAPVPATTSWPCRACWASWNISDKKTHPLLMKRILCHYAHIRI